MRVISNKADSAQEQTEYVKVRYNPLDHKKTADSKGRVVWTWEVGGRTSPGSWNIDVCGEEDCISSDFIVN